MSHAIGAVKFPDGTFKFYEYNGTADFCISHLYNTQEEAHENWRDHEENNCTCGQSEQVEIFTSYGSGEYFEGIGCRNCKSLSADEWPLYIKGATWANDAFDNLKDLTL